MNEPSYQDSCYAVIDLGDTYLESDGNSRGQLSQYVPASQADHLKTRSILLDSIAHLPIADSEVQLIPVAKITGNYPNPFNPSTTIAFSIPKDSNTKLSVYNIKGQKVKDIISGELSKGFHKAIWDGKDSTNRSVSSGIYIFRLASDGKVSVRKAMLMK